METSKVASWSSDNYRRRETHEIVLGVSGKALGRLQPLKDGVLMQVSSSLKLTGKQTVHPRQVPNRIGHIDQSQLEISQRIFIDTVWNSL